MGNSIEVGHGAINGGVDWKQEKLTSSSTTLSDSYKRDTTGLYLTGQQQIDSVTLEASGREDHDEQFGWHGTGRPQPAGSLLMVIAQRSLTVLVSGTLAGSAVRGDALCLILWAGYCRQPEPETGRIQTVGSRN